jgi:anti-sigma B factor antagonist
MQIHERASGGVAVLDVAGRMVLGERENDVLFRDAISSLLSAGRLHVVVNLADVTQIDTSGLTALVSAQLTAAQRGGAVKLTNAPERVRHVLGITRLNTLFEVYDNEAKAIASFGE